LLPDGCAAPPRDLRGPVTARRRQRPANQKDNAFMIQTLGRYVPDVIARFAAERGDNDDLRLQC
jgi:hypothetical protein